MDCKFEALDTDSSLRPTIISPGEMWTKRAQEVSERDCVCDVCVGRKVPLYKAQVSQSCSTAHGGSESGV
eukprot:5025303-Amphidinium_carterae.1